MNISNNRYEVILLEYVVQSGLQSRVERTNICPLKSITYAHRHKCWWIFHIVCLSLVLPNIQIPAPESLSQSQQSSIQNISLSMSSAENRGAQNTQTSPLARPFFLFLFLQQSKHVHAPKLQSLPMSEMQQLVEIHWLFRGPKLGTTLKCRLPLRFLIVHRFYASCHHIPLTLSHFNPSPPKIHCYKKDFHATDKYGGLCRCPKKKKKQMWLMHSFVHVSLMCQTFNLLVVVLPQ